MNKVVSICNRKGGVGKTTTTIAFAHTLRAQFGKSVVVIDTDPQATASLSLARHELRSGALADVQLEALLRQRRLDRGSAEVQQVVHRMAGALMDRPDVELSLVPISPAFWWLEEQTHRSRRFSMLDQTAPVRRFTRLVSMLRSHYDYVLIDTAPGATMLFRAIVMASDLIVVPCVPDEVSVWGLHLLHKEISAVLGAPEPNALILWTQFAATSNWRDHVRGFTADVRGFDYFRHAGRGPGEADEPIGIGQYVAIPQALANSEPRRWAEIYPAAVQPNLIAFTKEVIRQSSGALQ